MRRRVVAALVGGLAVASVVLGLVVAPELPAARPMPTARARSAGGAASAVPTTTWPTPWRPTRRAAPSSPALVDALGANGLRQVLFNLPAGEWQAGERGLACDPDRVGEFRDGVGRALDDAAALDGPQCNRLAGRVPDAVEIGRNPLRTREKTALWLRFVITVPQPFATTGRWRTTPTLINPEFITSAAEGQSSRPAGR
jgi:hypothetical protein